MVWYRYLESLLEVETMLEDVCPLWYGGSATQNQGQSVYSSLDVSGDQGERARVRR